MENKVGTGVQIGGLAVARGGHEHGIEIMSVWKFEAFDRDGNPKWQEEIKNIVVNTGLDELLDKFFKGSNYTAAFFVGLTDGTPTVDAGDTMAAHAGWAEITAYDEATRQPLTLGAVAGQAVNNSAAKATFTVSADSTAIGGGFIATDGAKGGAGGVLYCVSAFGAGDKSLDDGDTLAVTVTLTVASA